MKYQPILICTVLLLVSVLIACGGGKTSSEERSPGELAFRSNCQTCHSLPKPTMKTDEQWPTLVARYGERAKLSEEKQSLILNFLIISN